MLTHKQLQLSTEHSCRHFSSENINGITRDATHSLSATKLDHLRAQVTSQRHRLGVILTAVRKCILNVPFCYLLHLVIDIFLFFFCQHLSADVMRATLLELSLTLFSYSCLQSFVNKSSHHTLEFLF